MIHLPVRTGCSQKAAVGAQNFVRLSPRLCKRSTIEQGYSVSKCIGCPRGTLPAWLLRLLNNEKKFPTLSFALPVVSGSFKLALQQNCCVGNCVLPHTPLHLWLKFVSSKTRTVHVLRAFSNHDLLILCVCSATAAWFHASCVDGSASSCALHRTMRRALLG